MLLTKILMIFKISLITVRAVPVKESDLENKNSTMQEVNYRLPTNIVPIHYNIKLIPYIVIDNFTFDGETSIDIQILQPTTAILLHSKDLEIREESTYLRHTSNEHDKLYQPTKHDYDSDMNFLTVSFSDTLQPGYYNIYFRFVGRLNTDLYGFYRMSYTNNAGETIWLAATHFEATSARRAFPSWDEPLFKATFNISIKHHENYTVLSNMPISRRSSVDEEDGKIWSHFRTTPTMSTYLVAFALIIGYDHTSNADGTMRVWCRSDVAPYANHVFVSAEKATIELEKYMNSTVRVPKMDHVIVPRHAHTAMENWGLILYKESRVLYDANASSVTRSGAVAMIAAHELSHQWFGNMVSPSWWIYAWLNEGFATYLQYYITDKMFQDWHLMECFTISVVHGALLADTEMRVINYNVTTPAEIDSTFSSVTYYKSSSVIRMLSHCLTDDVFRNGLIGYISARQYKCASPDDLWEALQKALDESSVPRFSVKETMDTWIAQEGHPLVTVERDYATGATKITQEQYLRGGYNETSENIDGNKWWIPLNFATSTRPNFASTLPTHWLRPQDESFTLNDIAINDWIIVNAQQTGFYRVNYDAANWKRIANYLNSDDYAKIHVTNRAQIVNDAYHLTATGKLSLEIFLELTNYLWRETDFVPWYTGLDKLKNVQRELKNPELGKLLTPHLLGLMRKFIENTGIVGRAADDHITKLKRHKMLNVICMLGHSECRKEATKQLIAHLDNPQIHKIPDHLRFWTFCMGMKEANETIWSKMLQTHLTDSRMDTVYYLGCSDNSKIVINYLNMLISNNSVLTRSDTSEIYDSLLANGNYETVDIVLNFTIENWNTISSWYSVEQLTRLTGIIASDLASKQQLKKLRTFLNEIHLMESSDIIDAEAALTRVETYVAVVRNWLECKNETSDFCKDVTAR